MNEQTEPGAVMSSILEKLTESPGPMSRHPHSGANYHEADQIITHLNYALGPFGWDWTTGEHGFDELADEVYVVGTLTARVLVQTPTGDVWQTTAKTERGWKSVSRKRSDNSLVSLGDDYKGADTDALKRAARLLGVGLDAWAKTSPASAPRPARSYRVEPSALDTARAEAIVPSDPAARTDLVAAYVDLLARAQAHGFRASWTSTPPDRKSDGQLQAAVNLLHTYLSRQEDVA